MTSGGSNYRPIEEINKIVKDLDYILISEYIPKKGETRRVIIKDKIGYKYDISVNSLMNGHIPYFVYKNNPYTLQNIELWIKINNKQFYLCEENVYKNSKTKLSFYCLKCKDIFVANWINISTGNGCALCEGRQVGKYNNLATLRPDLKEEWNYKRNFPLKPEDVVLFCGSSVWWTCKICGQEWKNYIYRRSLGGGCPKCKFSRGEKRIDKYLYDNNFYYIKEKYFPDCKNVLLLPFDFYLPEYNLCIEYDGILHYIDKFNETEEFKKTKKRDKIKTKYCKNNNINLLRIPYWEFENIEKILEQTLFE